MPNARKHRALALSVALALAACHRQPSNQNISADNRIAANTEIEAVPMDESSATPANELDNGDDNPDVSTANSPANSD